VSDSGPTSPVVLNRKEIEALAGLESDAFDPDAFAAGAFDAIAEGFVRLARGEVRQPPVLSLDLPEVAGELDVKTAWVRGWDSFCVKLSTGFFRNPELGLPSGSGLMVVLDATTGRPRAVLLDDGLLTDLRTAIAGGLAARALARPDATVAAVLGAGAQARWQARALAAVRPLSEIRIWSRRPDAATQCARDVERHTGVPTRSADSVAEALRGADVVVTTTPSQEPIVPAPLLQPGMHLTSMGSDGAGKRELEAALLRRADLIVVDHLEQSRTIGELQGIDANTVSAPVTLGEILAGERTGRHSDDDVTVCDLTGTGVQDSAIARWLLGRYEAHGAGS